MKLKASARIVAIIAALLVTQAAASAGSIPRAPRDDIYEAECIGQSVDLNQPTKLYFMLGTGKSPGTSWARIERVNFKAVETPTTLIVAGPHHESTVVMPDYRIEVEFDSGKFRLFGLRSGKLVLLQLSLPGDAGCRLLPWKH